MFCNMCCRSFRTKYLFFLSKWIKISEVFSQTLQINFEGTPFWRSFNFLPFVGLMFFYRWNLLNFPNHKPCQYHMKKVVLKSYTQSLVMKNSNLCIFTLSEAFIFCLSFIFLPIKLLGEHELPPYPSTAIVPDGLQILSLLPPPMVIVADIRVTSFSKVSNR